MTRALACLVAIVLWQTGQAADAEFLRWSARQAESVGRGMYKVGRVGSSWDLRLLKTERAYNYKLAATWLTPDVVRAAVRLQQLANRFDDAEARRRVQAALASPEIAVLVEIDPREGSGVIPNDWIAILEPRAGKDRKFEAVAGKQVPERRNDPAFAGVLRRNYDYDRFWVSFPVEADGRPAIPPEATELDLIVRIYDKEGRVTWPVSRELRAALYRQ
jgi:hypothetical protein